ncbi:MAG TPA: hypothetical protein VN793_03085, partial [Acidimicrobiales bacterium]|nr:hypothetical protein [Acidimicrobiales bacterium]
KNVFWRDIPPGSTVKLVGHSYVVTLPDGTRASAYWGGQDARQAQQSLDRMARGGQQGPLRLDWGVLPDERGAPHDTRPRTRRR